jgi:hypothetical protein
MYDFPCSYFTYTTAWNVLDYPALVIPVSKVTEADVKKPPHEFLGNVDKTIYEACEFPFSLQNRHCAESLLQTTQKFIKVLR